MSMKITSNLGVQRIEGVGKDNSVGVSGRFLGTKAAERVISNFGDRAPIYTTSSVTASQAAAVDTSLRT